MKLPCIDKPKGHRLRARAAEQRLCTHDPSDRGQRRSAWPASLRAGSSAGAKPPSQGINGRFVPDLTDSRARARYRRSIVFWRRNGAPEEIRTPDPQIRSLVLYPAELRARFSPGIGPEAPMHPIKVRTAAKERFSYPLRPRLARSGTRDLSIHLRE